MKKFESYKDSGIEWIGKIPEHWDLKRLKRFAQICNGQDQKKVLQENGKYPIYGTGGIFGYADTFLYDKPSVLLGRKGTIDKPQYVNEPFWSVDTAYYTKINSETNPRFFYYLCSTINFDLYKYGSAIPSMTQSQLNEIPFCCPSLSEQNIISKFLDDKCAQIDLLIEKKQKLIELKKEERAAIINQAVTQGLYPNVPMKDSGSEWLGKIPEHWDLKKVSRVFRLIGSGTTPKAGDDKFYKDGTIPWVNTGDLNDGLLESCSKKITKDAFNEHSALKLFPKNSLIIAMYGATIGKLAINSFETTTNQACCVLGNSEEVITKYAFYWFLGNKNQIISLSYGGGQPNISQEIIRSIRISAPEKDEQSKIVDFLDDTESKYNMLFNLIEKQIELLQEYKTTLISDAVTGKINLN